MYRVYWSEAGDMTEYEKVTSEDFDDDSLSDALKFMEALRAKQRAGEQIRFVTMCSENPNSVGNPGVAEVSSDYNWKKRRA